MVKHWQNLGIFALGIIVGLLLAQVDWSTKEEPIATEVIEQPRDVASAPEPEKPEVPSNVPRFKDAGVLESNAYGEAHVRWTGVNGAARYELKVLDGQGNEVKTFRTKRTFYYLKELPVDPAQAFTTYSLKVAALSEKDELGPLSAPKELKVYPLRNLIAPSIKSIKTEE